MDVFDFNDPRLPRGALQLAKLRARQNPKGVILSGRIGGARLLIVQNPARDSPADADFLLLLQPALPRAEPEPEPEDIADDNPA